MKQDKDDDELKVLGKIVWSAIVAALLVVAIIPAVVNANEAPDKAPAKVEDIHCYMYAKLGKLPNRSYYFAKLLASNNANTSEVAYELGHAEGFVIGASYIIAQQEDVLLDDTSQDDTITYVATSLFNYYCEDIQSI